VGKTRFTRALRLVLAGLVAAMFFFAGYAVRTVREVSALATCTPTSIACDGDPSGHFAVPKVPQSPTLGFVSAFRKLFPPGPTLRAPLAIRYVTIPHQSNPMKPVSKSDFANPPTCKDISPPCVEFLWTDIALKNTFHDGSTHGPRLVDMYGTISLTAPQP
jgi:hypothetical protein